MRIVVIDGVAAGTSAAAKARSESRGSVSSGSCILTALFKCKGSGHVYGNGFGERNQKAGT